MAAVLVQISKLLEKLLNRKLNDMDRICLQRIAKEYISKDQADPAYALEVAARCFAELKKSSQIDMHEFLKTQIGTRADNDGGDARQESSQNRVLAISDMGAVKNSESELQLDINSILGEVSKFRISMALNPKSLIRKEYMLFDTRYAARHNLERTKFTWIYSSIPRKTDAARGIVSTTAKMRDIVSMKVYPVQFPFATSQQFQPIMNRYTLLVEEFSNQSFISYNGRRFHFLQSVYYPYIGAQDQHILLYTDKYLADGTFRFRKPITVIDTITLSFGNPYQLVPLLESNYSGCTINTTLWSSIGEITIHIPNLVMPTYVVPATTSKPFVYISGLSSSTSLDNNFVELINQQLGFAFEFDLMIPNQIIIYPLKQFFSLNNDPSSYTVTGVLSLCTLFLTWGSYRVAIEFEYLETESN